MTYADLERLRVAIDDACIWRTRHRLAKMLAAMEAFMPMLGYAEIDRSSSIGDRAGQLHCELRGTPRGNDTRFCTMCGAREYTYALTMGVCQACE